MAEPSANPQQLTRAQLSAFLPSHEAIKAWEQMFSKTTDSGDQILDLQAAAAILDSVVSSVAAEAYQAGKLAEELKTSQLSGQIEGLQAQITELAKSIPPDATFDLANIRESVAGMKITRQIMADVAILNTATTGIYTITPPLKNINKTLVFYLGAQSDAATAPRDSCFRIPPLGLTTQLSAVRTGNVGNSMVSFLIVEYE